MTFSLSLDTRPSAWVRIPDFHEGGPLYRNALTGEIAVEFVQDRRLVALPPDVEAAIRRRFDAKEANP